MNLSRKKTRFALIGCGRIAERHAAQMAQNGVIVAVCDVKKERADTLAGKYNAAAYYDIDKLLEGETGIDIAAICTPNALHAPHSISCLEAGMHVLCEKPMAIRVEDCNAMIAAAGKNNRMLAIVKQNRFNPPVIAVKQLLEKKILGRILSVQVNGFWNRDKSYYQHSDWKGRKETDGGTLFTQFSHFIDVMYWLAGDVTDVKAILTNSNHDGIIDFEDTGVAVLQFESGATGTLHYTVNSHAKNMEGSITVFGEKGTVKIGGEYLNKLEYQDIDSYIIPDLPKGNLPNDYGTYRGTMSNHDKVYDNLIDALKQQAVISANAYDGMKTVEIIQKIYDSRFL
jgi:UDP-N-acetyl-2-amino-2-deoxyglucuronate dehydrogenase